MIRNLKVLGLLAVAALATSAMVASAAQAEVTITSGTTPSTRVSVSVVGEQYGVATENYFEANGVKLSCENAGVSFTGTTATGDDKDLTLTPSYVDCGVINAADALGKPVTVNMSGCTYTFTQPTNIGGTPTQYTGNVDLQCAGGVGPIIKTFNNGTLTAHSTLLCETEIEPNLEISHIIYTNAGGTPDDITANVTGENIKYVNLAGIGCPHETKTNAKYISKVTLKSAGKDVSISG